MLLLIYFRLFYNTTVHCTIYTSTPAPTFPISTITVRLLLLLSVHLLLHLLFLSQLLQYAYFYFFLSIYFYIYSFYPKSYSTPTSTPFCPSTFTLILSILIPTVRKSDWWSESIFSVFRPTNKNKTSHTFFRYEKYMS